MQPKSILLFPSHGRTHAMKYNIIRLNNHIFLHFSEKCAFTTLHHSPRWATLISHRNKTASSQKTPCGQKGISEACYDLAINLKTNGKGTDIFLFRNDRFHRKKHNSYKWLQLQGVRIQQEVHKPHNENALFITPGFDVILHDDDFLEGIIHVEQRL